MSEVPARRAKGRALAPAVAALAVALAANALYATAALLPSPPPGAEVLVFLVPVELVELSVIASVAALAWVLRAGPGAWSGGTAGLLVLERVAAIALGLVLFYPGVTVGILAPLAWIGALLAAPNPRAFVVDGFVALFSLIGVFTARSAWERLGALATAGCGLVMGVLDLAGVVLLNGLSTAFHPPWH